MVLDGLGKSLRGVLDRIGSSTTVDENLIKDVCRELQRALLQADVNVQLVLKLTNNVRERSLNEKPPAGRSAKDHVRKVIYEELVALLKNGDPIALKPQTIMLVGLYGQGKTTSAGKLANYFIKKGFTVGLIGADVYRPAAYDQLKQLGDKVGAEVYGEPGQKDAVKIVRDGLAKLADRKIKIIDTSGRHALEDDLIEEIIAIAKVAKPDERVLVLDSQVGQQAGPQADAFNKAVDVSGVIMTKMDGTAKGGGALSAVATTDARIVFIGTGEHIRDLEPFDADRFISRLLGMGDLQGLVEIAKQEIENEESMEELARNMMSGRFTLTDMYNQMKAVKKMGTLQKIVGMLPGLSKVEDKIDFDSTEARLDRFKVIMDSMTQQEKDEPSLIKGKRIDRIAHGAGVTTTDVRELLKQYNNSKKMMGSMSKDRKMRKRLQKQFGGMDPEAFKDMENGSE
ncbi:signal recognition particle subunit FFH/SRP54 (srp54) [Thermoplasmatales archaeon BRNA1]|nr:signal recognition particle subunit FFH/SRP54 (srp54) [Thermoplasmatales archaeon BRNA1]